MYIDMHKYLSHNKVLSARAIGKIYKSIDPCLRQTVNIEINSCRKINSLESVDKQHSHKVKYCGMTDKKAACLFTRYLEPDPHYLQYNVDQRERRLKQRVKCMTKAAKAEAKSVQQQAKLAKQQTDKATRALADITNRLQTEKKQGQGCSESESTKARK